MSCNCTNTVTSIAGEIINDLDNDSSLSASYISAWIQGNLGKLNNLIGTSFSLDDSLDITPCMDDNQKDILKNLYLCHYWNIQTKANLGASNYDWVEIQEGDSVIRRASKNEIAKTFMQLSKQCQESLNQLAKFYKQHKCLPLSISSSTTNMWLYEREED